MNTLYVTAITKVCQFQEFAIVSDPAVIKKFSTDNSIVLYKQFDEGEVKMEGICVKRKANAPRSNAGGLCKGRHLTLTRGMALDGSF